MFITFDEARHQSIDLFELFGSDGTIVGEIKTELFGNNFAALLIDVAAKSLGQSPVEHMSGRVVGSDLKKSKEKIQIQLV